MSLAELSLAISIVVGTTNWHLLQAVGKKLSMLHS
jgi:hypothetical protein